MNVCCPLTIGPVHGRRYEQATAVGVPAKLRWPRRSVVGPSLVSSPASHRWWCACYCPVRGGSGSLSCLAGEYSSCIVCRCCARRRWCVGVLTDSGHRKEGDRVRGHRCLLVSVDVEMDTMCSVLPEVFHCIPCIRTNIS